MQKSKNNFPLIVVPAAGFGTRVGSPPAKELLPDSDGRPLIQWALDQGLLRGWPVHVILRKEKTALIDYLDRQGAHLVEGEDSLTKGISYQVIEPSQEWPETLLKSETFWRPQNLMILPDTRFAPTSVLDQMFQSLDLASAVYAGFLVSSPESWGVIAQGSQIFEKCAVGPGPHWAWGVMGFQKQVGAEVLRSHLRSTIERVPTSILNCSENKKRLDFFTLEKFEDLTRG